MWLIFYAFTERNLNIWTTKSDCPSKIKVANESLTVAMVEAVECLLSKLWCCSAEDYLWNVSFIEFFMLGVQKRIVYAMYILVIILFYTS